MPDDASLSLYINFVLCAVYGRLREADAIMKKYGQVVRDVADFINRKLGIPSKPIYRGMLLDPTVPFKHDPQLTFLSWSEDHDVARWFASKRSTISDYVLHCRPTVRGYIVTLPKPTTRVLFHFSWARLFNGLSDLAREHPLMGEEGKRQIAWSLKTQQEVITDPVDGLEPQIVDEIDITALDERFAPPWLR